jgi:tetraacyldisaccharide 4'-kinase
MFFNFFLRSFRILLFPFSLLYAAGSRIRNFLFDKKILMHEISFNLPIICVGNLAVGGTGKSPMVELLIVSLKQNYKIATLSRGYKRKTKGYVLADERSTALEIGDEPMQFHLKFPDVPVAVGEERVSAIPQLLFDKPDTQVIILDDAFQHRYIKAGLNILLTDYNNLFYRDFMLPTGDLRDNRSSYKRADIIVVTKCKPDLTEEEAKQITEEIAPLPHQKIFFSFIRYGTPYHIVNRMEYVLHPEAEVLLVTGIANPEPLKKYILKNTSSFEQMLFSDHYIFNIDDLREIKKRYEEMDHQPKIIITTEKDAVRLMKFKEELNDLPLYVLPVQHEFLFGHADDFHSTITTFITQFKKNKDGQEE